MTELQQLQEHLHQTQKLETVGHLAAGIAHDFNNLLTVIRTYCELILLELSPSSPHREELTEIHSAAERAGTLARQLLSVGRRNTLLAKPLDINEVIRGVEAMLRRVTRSGVTVKTVLDHSLGVMCADPSQIEQVLMNLVINAVDAMPTGGEILLRTSNAELDRHYASAHPGVIAGGYVRLTVSDTGSGMDRASLTHALTRFGYTVLDANHGGAAIRIAAQREQTIDLLLTDLHMPGMDGRDLAVRVSAIHPETKVLFMSGSFGGADALTDGLGADDIFIAKPFSADDLALKIREVLARS